MDSLLQQALQDKRVLIREDLNVPIEQGQVSSDARLLAVLPTIKLVIEKGARVILCSHLGRPTEGKFESQYSLAPVATRLSELLGQPVRLIEAWREPFDVASGEVVLLENVRFNVGEKANDPQLAQAYAKLCDLFVMDAFATAHRAQASTTGVIEFATRACAGPLLEQEIAALSDALIEPKRPLLAIVGGSKVSTKLTVLQALAEKVDHLIVGGGIANTFIAASGFSVGQSLYEPDLLPLAKELMETIRIPIPQDVVVADQFSVNAKARVADVQDVMDSEHILDIGPKTAKHYAQLCVDAGTILWNGPVGVFEWPQFAEGTRHLAQAIAQSNAFSIAGGGDTLAALDQFGVREHISYVSTGGGAFLEFIEGKRLSALAALQLKSTQQEMVKS